VNVKRIHSKAGLGTLALSGEMNNIQTTVLIGRKISGFNSSNTRLQYEGSVNICMDSTRGVLLENDTKQNVVEVTVSKSHMFGCLKNFLVSNTLSSFIHVGQIGIDVPLRPMIVHGVVYRESKEIEQNILPELKNFSIFENIEPDASNSSNTTASAQGGMQGTGGGGSGKPQEQHQQQQMPKQSSADYDKAPVHSMRDRSGELGDMTGGDRAQRQAGKNMLIKFF
jgi:hypothetical protein